MMALNVAITTVSSTGLFGALAMERARAYGLRLKARHLSTWCALAIAAALEAWRCAQGIGVWQDAVLVGCAAVGAISDVQTGYIFDRVLLAGAGVMLTGAAACGRMEDALCGGALAGGMVAIPFLCTGARGMGFGDVKFAAVLGIGLRSSHAIAGVWLAIVLAGAAASCLLLLGRATAKGELRFGPFLALGTGLVLAGVL